MLLKPNLSTAKEVEWSAGTNYYKALLIIMISMYLLFTMKKENCWVLPVI